MLQNKENIGVLQYTKNKGVLQYKKNIGVLQYKENIGMLQGKYRNIAIYKEFGIHYFERFFLIDLKSVHQSSVSFLDPSA
jgi:glycerol-3-phosphate responsive antiterminator